VLFHERKISMHTVEEGLVACKLRRRLPPELLQCLTHAAPIHVESHRVDCKTAVSSKRCDDRRISPDGAIGVRHLGQPHTAEYWVSTVQTVHTAQQHAGCPPLMFLMPATRFDRTLRTSASVCGKLAHAETSAGLPLTASGA